MQSFLLQIALLATFSTTMVSAWGGMGHRLTGKVAMRLVSDDVKSQLTSLISDMDGGDLGRAATWADEVKRKAGYGWSGVLHYVNSKDNPPHDCSFEQERDCANGKCLTGAIANYTSRLSCRYNEHERGEAVKFLTHFMGDLTQPLHVCDRLKGGNSAPAKFDGKSSKVELHSIWDTQIVEKRVKIKSQGSEDTFADYLADQVNNGAFSSEASDWSACADRSGNVGLTCAVEWAKDSDGLNCDIVWKLYDANPTADLGKAYFEKAWPVMEKQVAKAGVRMAKWFENNLKPCSS